jgi:hypothetical protein
LVLVVLTGTDLVLAATQHLKAAAGRASRLTANDATGLSRYDLHTGARLRVALQAKPGE